MRGTIRFVNGAVYEVVGVDHPGRIFLCPAHGNDPCDLCYPPDSPRDLLP